MEPTEFNFFHKSFRYPWEPIEIPAKAPCPQKILMVTDGFEGNFLNGSFNHYYFGLSAVIDTLLDQSDYFVNFRLTLAHRQVDNMKPSGPVTDPEYMRYGPNFENFRFTTTENDVKTGQPFDIYDYDQIWLFGVRDFPDDSEKLDDDELPILTDWMEKGGGVFATGDHAKLGVSLCGRVPRVSKMRMWDNLLKPNGDLLKTPPPQLGPGRHDTLVKGHDDIYTFDDESDDIPMKITPKYYLSRSLNPMMYNKFPHPILCGKEGVIDILPDHPHEGEIIEEDEVDISDKLYNGDPEFPKIGAFNFRPEVIAHAHVLPDHTHDSDHNKGPATAKTFGAIGVYDGYKTDVGRVVVDSTWHHWFDVNLIGRPVDRLDSLPFDDTNLKTQGFLASPEGEAAYRRIQNYFINVGLWLAPKTDRYCMLKGLIWPYVFQYPLVERVDPKVPVTVLGEMAKDALGNIAGQCNLRLWIFELLPAPIKIAFEKFELLPREKGLTLPSEQLLEIYVLGTITRNLLVLARSIENYPAGDERAQSIVKKNLDRGIKEGLTEGVERMIDDLDANMSQSRRHLRKMQKVMATIHKDSERQK